MERDTKLEQIFIMSLADVSNDKEFLKSALTLMDTDEQRVKVIKFIEQNKGLTKKDVQKRMAYISVGMK